MSKKAGVFTMLGFGVGMIVGCTTAAVVADPTPKMEASTERDGEGVVTKDVPPSRAPVVVNLTTATAKVSPNGMARAALFASGEEAYYGFLELEAGVSVPEHADPTEEFIYVIQGSGELVIDGVTHSIGPQTAVYMPRGAVVSYKNGDAPMIAVQVFGEPGPEKKYEAWGTP